MARPKSRTIAQRRALVERDAHMARLLAAGDSKYSVARALGIGLPTVYRFARRQNGAVTPTPHIEANVSGSNRRRYVSQYVPDVDANVSRSTDICTNCDRLDLRYTCKACPRRGE